MRGFVSRYVHRCPNGSDSHYLSIVQLNYQQNWEADNIRGINDLRCSSKRGDVEQLTIGFESRAVSRTVSASIDAINKDKERMRVVKELLGQSVIATASGDGIGSVGINESNEEEDLYNASNSDVDSSNASSRILEVPKIVIRWQVRKGLRASEEGAGGESVPIIRSSRVKSVILWSGKHRIIWLEQGLLYRSSPSL